MDLKDFLNKFGDSTTTNFQLIKWSKELGIKPFYYVMRNEIKKLKKIKIFPVYIIANYQTTSESGSHHVALCRDSERSFYLDPFGIHPFKEAINFLEDGVYRTFKIQPIVSSMCGQLCL